MGVFWGPAARGGANAPYIRSEAENGAGRIHFARAFEIWGPRPAQPGGAHDHAMDDIRYFVMGLEEKGGGVAAAYIERRI